MSTELPIAALQAYGSAQAGSRPSSLSPLSARENQDIDEVARDFESVFLSQMMSHMFSGDEANAYFGGGAAGDIYKGFLMNEYGKAIANAGGIGIASSIKQELLKLQEM